METAKMFKQNMTTIRIEIQTATLICCAPSQYWMTIDAAEISTARTIEQLYQFYVESVSNNNNDLSNLNSRSSQPQIQGRRRRSGHRIEAQLLEEAAKSPSHRETAS